MQQRPNNNNMRPGPGFGPPRDGSNVPFLPNPQMNAQYNQMVPGLPQPQGLSRMPAPIGFTSMPQPQNYPMQPPPNIMSMPQPGKQFLRKIIIIINRFEII